MGRGIPQAEVIVVGSGPNGLAAAVTMARAGREVLLVEAADRLGGGTRSAELTRPGFLHDECSAIHPLGIASPFFRRLPLREHGLEWIQPEAPLAHLLDDGEAVVVERSVAATARTLGPDAEAYRRLMEPLVEEWDALLPELLAPPHWPRHALRVLKFARRALDSTQHLAARAFRGRRARALLAGVSAHAFLPLDRLPTAAFGLILAGSAHAVGWPLARGGSQRIADALVAVLREHGGRIVTGTRVDALDDLPPARTLLLDVTPRQLLALAGRRLGAFYRGQLRAYRYGPGVFKVDWALDGPIPWRAAECRRAGTLHVGGPLEEIAAGEREVWQGRHPERPFLLVAQPSLFDPTRAPAGRHTGWAYCHVPNGSTFDMTERIERQVERFAPGFRERILARHTRNSVQLQAHNANCVGGDINGGLASLDQLLFRPAVQWNPYATGLRGVYLCSSSTPPGGGVHGLCGYYAAERAQ